MAGLRMSAAPFFLTMLTVFLSIIAAQVRLVCNTNEEGVKEKQFKM
jgi:hypothetical protein